MACWRLGGRLAAAAGVLLAVGCGGPAGTAGSPPPDSAQQSYSQLAPPRAVCGTSRTAVDVPVLIEVEKGSVSCPVALRVQAAYDAAIRAGKVRGNGGGAPVRVSGWTCQGLATTAILQTGEASHCGKDGTEIVAVLATQSPYASPAGP